MSRLILLCGTAIALAIPFQTASAQQAAPAPTTQQVAPAGPTTDEELLAEDEEAILVVGQRERGAVIGDIPPENQLGPRDIRAYGAATVAELLEAIAPMTQSGRGRDGGAPVVLLNGRRISGFREIRDLPPEAILRVDILPEEVALKYGYRADQRVVNIVLRPRFRSTAVRARGGVPTEGGRTETEADVTRLMIGQDSRTTINLHAERATALTEAERDVAFNPDDPDEIDPRPFRTLIGSRNELRAGGTMNRTLFGDVSTTVDGQIEWSEGRSLLGPSLIDAGEPLTRDSDRLSGHAGLAMNGDKGSWRWSLTGAYDRSRSRSETERESDQLAPFEDRTRTVSSTGNLDLVANGPLLELPAGRATATVRLGGDTRDLDARSLRAGVTSESDLGRDRLSSALSLDLPVSKRDGALSAMGNLSLNANAEVEQLSDFGTLTTLGAGAYWSPVKQLNLIASWTREQGAPSLTQLGDPVVVTPDARVFDFRTGETVLVDAVSGGNPDLDSDTRNVFKLGGTYRPSDKLDLEIRADYTRSRVKGPVASFPGPTQAIEAAFPERFQRDAEGNLVRVDLRPVNFESSARDELRWGFNFTKPLRTARPSQSTIDQLREQFRRRTGDSPPRGRRDGGEAPPPAPPADGAPPEGAVIFRDGPPGGDGGGGPSGPGAGPGGGRGGFRFGGPGGGRLQLSVYHTVALKDEAVIRPGLPTLDFLDGEATASGAGRSRHRIQADAGYYNNGLGLRLSSDWQSGSKVVGSETGTLEFSPLTKFNLSAFANLGERLDLVTEHPWLRGTQVRLGVDNLFDAKQKVRDAAGNRPLSFQQDLIDPQGRTIMISFRKLFSPPPQFRRREVPAGETPPAPTN